MLAAPMARPSPAATTHCVLNTTGAPSLLLLLILCGPASGPVHDAAQRASDEVILARVLRAPVHHFLLELRVRHRHLVAQLEEHVGHRAVARALPVARVGRVLVRR